MVPLVSFNIGTNKDYSKQQITHAIECSPTCTSWLPAIKCSPNILINRTQSSATPLILHSCQQSSAAPVKLNIRTQSNAATLISHSRKQLSAAPLTVHSTYHQEAPQGLKAEAHASLSALHTALLQIPALVDEQLRELRAADSPVLCVG
jgi:hypothetical protein